MVPCHEILAKAKVEGADIVGLSGLITPSLEEMQYVASEMQKDEHFRIRKIPLLIGGATTSRVHTAVKINPNYRRGQTVYVNDASRAVGVASSLMSREARPEYVSTVRAEYARIAAAHARAQEDKERLSLAAARANRLKVDWSPFFSTWELQGKFPAILQDEKFGEAARGLYDDAQAMLRQITSEGWFKAGAVVGFWPANTIGDDIAVYNDEKRGAPLAMLHTLRQQLVRREGRANVALADFVAPHNSGVADYVGGFVVTAGVGEEDATIRFKRANDDYSAILVKALADRLAEAFAERMHERVRKELWAYASDETLDAEALIRESYRGIRPAPGYPAQPDHTEKATLFKLLAGEERIGVKLTESFAMWPGASVCGLYFAHPESHYFGVGKIERDQVEDYAARKGWTVEECERWLMPILNYNPAQAKAPEEVAA
jgi:5-methyltetrahydrofolate--homocysteine methyltransferase